MKNIRFIESELQQIHNDIEQLRQNLYSELEIPHLYKELNECNILLDEFYMNERLEYTLSNCPKSLYLYFLRIFANYREKIKTICSQKLQVLPKISSAILYEDRDLSYYFQILLSYFNPSQIIDNQNHKIQIEGYVI